MTDEPNDVRLVAGSDPDPASPNHAPEKSANDARAGVELGTMRWVLRISMGAVVVALAVVWLAIRG